MTFEDVASPSSVQAAASLASEPMGRQSSMKTLAKEEGRRAKTPRWVLGAIVVALLLALLAADFRLFGSRGGGGSSVLGAADCYLGIVTALLAFYGLLQTRPKNGAPSPMQPSMPRGNRNVSRGAAQAAEQRLCTTIEQTARKQTVAKAGQVLLDFERDGGGRVAPLTAYEQVIRACARVGDAKAAQLWFSRLNSRGIKVNTTTLNSVLDACAKAEDPEACEMWLRRMIEKNVQPNVVSYSMVISVRAHRGEQDLAIAWFQCMCAAGVEPDAVCYNSLIHACSVHGDVTGAEHWIKDMQAHGIDATVTTYTAVVDACAKSGQIATAEVWMERMVAQGVKPNVVSFCAVIDACAKSGDPPRAVYWHEKMVKMGVSPNAHSYSAVINAYAKVGDAPTAELWLGNAEREDCCGGDVVVYSSVIGACAKANDPERALAVYHRMRDKGIRPHIVAYAALARTLAYRGSWVQVERIACDMAADGVKTNEYFVYAQLLSYASCKPRQEVRAEACFRQAIADRVPVNDHISAALARALGRPRSAELLSELCSGPPLPLTPQRRGHPGRDNFRERPPRDHI